MYGEGLVQSSGICVSTEISFKLINYMTVAFL